MRIVSGSLKGRVIKIDKDLPLRPTSEKVREALFSVLTGLVDLTAASALDLFAGSGAVGFEAISRGFSFVSFVEKNPKISKGLKTNIELFNLGRVTEVFTASAEKSLANLNKQYDFVFIDPPYKEHPGLSIVEKLANYKLLKPNALVVVESEKKFELSGELKGFDLLKEKIYGDTKLTFYRYQGIDD